MALKTEVSQSWLELLQEKLNVESLKGYFTEEAITQLLFYGGSGLLAGFLSKKFGRYFVFTLIFGIALLYGLQYLGIVTLDVEKLRNLIGLTSADSLETIFRLLTEWILNNIVYSIVLLVSFIIGYKIGS